MPEKTDVDVYFPMKPEPRDGEEVQFCVECLVWVPMAEKRQHLALEHPQ